MKIIVCYRDREIHTFENVREWFISSDNRVVHIKGSVQHSIIPMSELSVLTACEE